MSKRMRQARPRKATPRRSGSNSARRSRTHHTVLRGRPAVPAARVSQSVADPLARLLESPHLERIVPHLAPETLHRLINRCGLEACGELVVSASPQQLTALLDLDLWRTGQPGRDAAGRATLDRQTRAVSATAFTFIESRSQIDEVRAFMDRLLEILTG